jgi:hypothetical protein
VDESVEKAVVKFAIENRLMVNFESLMR